MRTIQRLVRPWVRRSFVEKFGLGKTRRTLQYPKTAPMTVPDLRDVMEKVYQSETHLQTFGDQSQDDADAPRKEKAPV